MLKFYHILLLTLVAVFIASAAGIARYAADSCSKRECIGSLPRRQKNSPMTPRQRGMIFAAVSGAVHAKQRPCRLDTD